MRKELKCFFEKLFTEPEFRQLFLQTNSAQEGYELAKPYLGGVSFKEFKDGVAYVHKKLYDKHYKEISPSDLKHISGGRNEDKMKEIINILNYWI
ncbi:MAG: hypothetical protein IJ758_04445 [Clostridia bacterium]|nr:hypothetical protein [Clostridia bacterium]